MKSDLASKNEKCEDSASMNTLEKELTEARERIQDLEEEVIQHVEAIGSLQAQLKKEDEDGVDSNKSANEEVCDIQYTVVTFSFFFREKEIFTVLVINFIFIFFHIFQSQTLQKLEKIVREEVMPHHQSFHSSESASPWDISCKISETLQVLEESVMFPSTPGRNSAGNFLDEPLIQPNDLVLIKQQLMKLQDALIAQDQQRRFLNATDMEWRNEYHNQVLLCFISV